MTELALGDRPLTFRDINGDRPHTLCRQEINAKLLALAASDLGIADLRRTYVPDAHVSWDVNVPGYAPHRVDIPRGNSSARKPGDVPHPYDARLIKSFTSISGLVIVRNARGEPYNIQGRTGLDGRGMLDRWGETEAADLLLSRINPTNGEVEVASVQREDTGEWGLPGGKLNAGESPEDAAFREFTEEAGGEGLDLGPRDTRRVYRDYIDDTRNTDKAWMATTVVYAHLDPVRAARLELVGGSDATNARWRPISRRFFAMHGQIAIAATRGL